MISTVAPIHRLSTDDVLRMVAAGVLDEHERVELVDGVLVDMTPIGARHDAVLARLGRWAVEHSELTVRVQSMLLIEGGFVLPDLTATDPLPDHEQPRTARLVVEVAETSLARDREKALTYAGAGVPDYWIIDLGADAVVVHRELRDGFYGDVRAFARGTDVPPSPSGLPAVAVDAILGYSKMRRPPA